MNRLLFYLLASGLTASGKVVSKLKCGEKWMNVEIVPPHDKSTVYLEGLAGYPDEACHPTVKGDTMTFNLSLTDFYQCGVTRMINKGTGLTTYYHRIVIENDDLNKDVLTVKCLMKSNHTVTKRNVLPAGFQEPTDLDITSEVTEMAPQPKLNVGVRQDGKVVNGELNVNPGTPLQMEIYLDDASAPVYGILVSYMTVSDTVKHEESIIFNGCAVDSYLFENFNTDDGDFLTAKFRAFKFPDSNYVQFKGTVNVCLDKCIGVDCSNGQTGFGRRKRSIPEIPPDPNKLFEISITSFFKVNYKERKTIGKEMLEFGNEESRITGEEESVIQEVENVNHKNGLELAEEKQIEKLFYNVNEGRTNSESALTYSTATLLATAAVRLLI